MTRAGPYAALVALNVLFHFPALLNAAGVNSDAAIVGLQAMHFLDGETSRFLWGAEYQGTFDVWMVAAFFALGGPTPLMLTLAPFVGHLVLTCVAFAFLSRVLAGRAAAFLVCLPLVFTPQAVNGIVTAAPRHWSVTVALCGAMIAAWPGPRSTVRIGIGAALSIFAVYLDLFAVIWVPALGVLLLLVCLEPFQDLASGLRRCTGAAAGAAVGVVLAAAMRSGATSQRAFELDWSFIDRNWMLLRDTSLPWLLGAKVWIPGEGPYPDLWQPPMPVTLLQWIGAASVVVLVLASAVLLFSRRVRWEIRRPVAFGVTATCTALAGFLMTNWPSDLWTTRYLAPIIWTLPFSLAALASVVRPGLLAALLAPYLIVAALGGWLSRGPYVNGAMPRLDTHGAARPETELGDFLRQRGFDHGYAGYWLAHRLTFLWREHPAIASFEPNRYPPYAEAAARARKKAYILNANEPPDRLDWVLSDLRKRPGRFEIVQVAGFTVILYEES